jgi:hypothetical protein
MLTLTLSEPRPTLLSRVLNGLAHLRANLDLASELARLDCVAAREVLERRGLIQRSILREAR